MEDMLLQYISSVVTRAAATASDTLKPRLDEKDILFVVRVRSAYVCMCVMSACDTLKPCLDKKDLFVV